jgi:transcription initiation factor TFIID subunit 6
LLPRITKTLLRGLGGENRGLGSRWGAARGLSGIVVGGVGSEPSSGVLGVRTIGQEGQPGGGGNRAIRDWIGGGLRTLGEMLGGEEESYEGERDEVVREIYVRQLYFTLFSKSKESCCVPTLTDVFFFVG